MDSTKRINKNERKLKYLKILRSNPRKSMPVFMWSFRNRKPRSNGNISNCSDFKNMFKRLRLKIKKQRRTRRNEEIWRCLNKLEYLRHQEGNRKEMATKLIQSWNYFFWRKFGTNSEISKLESNNDLKDWDLPLKQMLGMKMFHHVYYSEVFLNWPHRLQSFSLRDRGSSQAWESARGTGTP